MSGRRALIVIPGRGSYGRENLGSLRGMSSPSLDVFDKLRADLGRPTVRELDEATGFSSRSHVAGENASALTAGVSLADLDQLDPEKVQPVCVVGNSMGWYVALGYAGGLPMQDCAHLVETLGQYQASNVIGGQILYPVMDERWLPDPARLALVEAAVREIPDLHWSIRLSGQAVLGGTEAALAAAIQRLPPVQLGPLSFPLRLPLHSAFHTPLMAGTSARAMAELSDLDWSAPRLPMIDGRGRIWRPRISDPAGLRDYTLGEQITAPFDFSAAVRVALREYAPDLVVLPGPGSNLGGAIAAVMIREGWRGIHDRSDFLARQNTDPVLASMRWPGQRELVI